MINKEVTANVPEKKAADGSISQKAIGPYTVMVPFPENLEEAREWCGEEAMLSNAFANWRVTIQGNMRSSMKSGLTPDQVQEKLATAKMGVASVGGRIDPQQAFIAKFKMSTPEQQAEMLEQLRAAAAAE